ncbi:MAG: IS110 family transposase [Gammaproteobacteria bacterium]|nr:IS110 family transposase [Gammaproteobacteria bacterium]
MFYGLDIHKKFIQVCRLDAHGMNRCDFKIDADRPSILSFAQSLGDQDAAVLESTFHTWAIWSLLQQHGNGARIVVANSMQVKAIADARVKTDKIDAHILAQLLRTDFIPDVVMPDTQTWELRQLMTHRQLLARHRTAVRNAVCGVLHRKLLMAPMRELFGPTDRQWLQEQHYSDIERLILDGCLSQLDSIDERIRTVDAKLRQMSCLSTQVKLLITIPGVNITVANGLIAAIGDISRFDSAEKLTAYFGLVPKVSQSADRCFYGPITKDGRSQARWLAVEAAHGLVTCGSPLTASYHRIRRKKCHNVAVVALARKLVIVVWHQLTHQEPYRYAPVIRTSAKLRRVSPQVPPAKVGLKPTTLEEIYTEIGLPPLRPASSGEKRVAANNKRAVTRYCKERGHASADS